MGVVTQRYETTGESTRISAEHAETKQDARPEKDHWEQLCTLKQWG